MKKPLIVLVALVLAAFSLAACGDDDEDEPEAPATTEEPATEPEGGGGGGGGGAVEISAVPDGSFAFEQSELTASAGPTSFEFDNPASLGHDFCLEQDGSEVGCTEVVTEDSDTLEAELESGEYTYFCSVAGHRDGGMEGTLTVE